MHILKQSNQFQHGSLATHQTLNLLSVVGCDVLQFTMAFHVSLCYYLYAIDYCNVNTTKKPTQATDYNTFPTSVHKQLKQVTDWNITKNKWMFNKNFILLWNRITHGVPANDRTNHIIFICNVQSITKTSLIIHHYHQLKKNMSI